MQRLKGKGHKHLVDLVQMDTIHYIRSDGTRFYIYVLIDIYSRIGYAHYKKSLSAANSYKVVQNFRKMFPFKIKVIQTNNGSEFSTFSLNYVERA